MKAIVQGNLGAAVKSSEQRIREQAEESRAAQKLNEQETKKVI